MIIALAPKVQEPLCLRAKKISKKPPCQPSHPHQKAFSLLNPTDFHNLTRLKTRSCIKTTIISEVVRNAG
jgi:hypothetical protein